MSETTHMVNDILESLHELVEDNGLAVVSTQIPHGEDSKDFASHSYSVGLTAQHMPELMMRGLEPKVAMDNINWLYREYLDDEAEDELVDGDEFDLQSIKPINGQDAYKFMVKEIKPLDKPDDVEHTNEVTFRINHCIFSYFMCLRLNCRQSPRLFQLVWQCAARKYPWEEGYSAGPHFQPLGDFKYPQ